MERVILYTCRALESTPIPKIFFKRRILLKVFADRIFEKSTTFGCNLRFVLSYIECFLRFISRMGKLQGSTKSMIVSPFELF